MVYEELVAAQFRVKHKDFFHLRNLYILIHEWLIEEGWATRVDEDFPEKYYLHRETQKAGNEVWIWWRFKQWPTGNKYYFYDLTITWHVILLKSVEVKWKGQNYKSNWGEVEIVFDARVKTNPDLEQHWLIKHFNDIFRGRIFKQDLEKHKMELYRDVYRLQETVKYYLQLKTYLPEPEHEGEWMPIGGIGE